MSDFQPYLWDDDDDDVMVMVPDDCDEFFIMSKTIFKGFEMALGDNPRPLLENMTSGFENYRRLYQSAMIEYGDAMKAKINECRQNGTHNAYRVFVDISSKLLCGDSISWASIIQVLILGCILAKQNKGDSYFSKGTITCIVGKILLSHEEWIVANGGYQSLVDELSYLVRLKSEKAGRHSDAIKLALVGGIAAVGAYAAYKAIKYFFW